MRPTLRPSSRRNAYGVARLRRDSYSNRDTQTDWWTIRNAVFARDGGKCQARVSGNICGKAAKEVHHIVPLSRGGITTKANLISLCTDCHDARHRGKNRR